MKAKLTNPLMVETLAKKQRLQIWDTQLTGLYSACVGRVSIE